MSLSATILTSEADLMRIRDDWQSLLEHSDADTIFLTPEWIQTWLAVSDTPIEAFVIAVYKNGDLIGLAPFHIVKLRLFKFIGLRCLRIMADENTSAEYQDLILHRRFSEEALQKIATVLQENISKFSLVWIRYTDLSRGATARFQLLFSKLNLYHRSREFSYYSVNLPKHKSEVGQLLTRKQRRNVKRYQRQLAERDEITLVNLVDGMSADEIFEILVSLHDKRWISKGQSGVFQRRPLFRKFHRQFLDRAVKHQWLAALCLYQGSEPIAIRFGYIYKGVFYGIQSGFIPDLNGAGIVNIFAAMEYAVESHLEQYDFLAHEGETKTRFGAKPRAGRQLFAAKKNVLNKLMMTFGIWPTGRFMS